MTTAPLTFAEVLRDEYEYFHDPGALRKWELMRDDIRELHSLVEKIKAIRCSTAPEGTFSFCLLELARRSEGDSADQIIAALQKMADDPELFTTLLKDIAVKASLLDEQNPLLRKLASVPRARTMLLQQPDLAARILADDTLLDLFTSRSAALRLLLAEGVKEILPLYPELLATVADSEPLSDYLLASSERANALIELFRGASTRSRSVRRLFWQQHQTFAIVQDDMKLLAADAGAILARLQRTPRREPPRALDAEALSQFNILLLESAYGDYVADGHDLRDIYGRIHEKNVAALCLSGGGIRSATFNLGVLQGLAEQKLLTQFHYLSTVSGGGYIGGWLSSWMRRHTDGPWGVAKDLCAKPEDPLAPEVKTIEHLREYSSYLAPHNTALSVDTWTLVATYLRNLLLNWTMFLPALMAVLAAPRAVDLLVTAALIYGDTFQISVAAISAVAATFGVIAVGIVRPAVDQHRGKPPKDEELREQRKRFRWWLLPLLVAGIGFTAYWAALPDPGEYTILGLDAAGAPMYVVLFAIGNVTGAFIYGVRRAAASLGLLDSESRTLRGLLRLREWLPAVQSLLRGDYRKRVVREMVAGLVAGAVGGALLYAIFRVFFPPWNLDEIAGWPRMEVYVCLAMPLFLLVFFVQASLLVGLTTDRSTDHDREWWARSSSLIFVSGVAYFAIAAAVILVPILIIELPELMAPLGGVSGFVAWLFTRAGGKSKAKPEEQQPSPVKALAHKLAVVVFLFFILGGLSLVSTYVLGWVGTQLDEVGTALAGRAETTSSTVIEKVSRGTAKIVASSTILKETAGYLAEQKMTFLNAPVHDPSRWHVIVLRGTSELVLVVFMAMMMLIAYMMSRLLNVNIYSMHGMYRNRLIRAYLGASRWRRRPDPFTGFDPQDNVKMWQLQPEAIWSSSFADFDAFVHALLEKQGDENAKPRSAYWQLPADLRTRLFVYDVGRKVALRGVKSKAPARQDVEADLIEELNTLLVTRDIERDLEAKASIGLIRANRRYLERCFDGILDKCPDDRTGGEIEKHRNANGEEIVVGAAPRLRKRPPLHVINTALNLVGGDNLAWRERKADSFTITPLHAGNKRLGYRHSTSYGEEISLGTAVAISGAAVSPNHGYNSSPIVTFLMTLFNARLGWWLGNPGRAGDETYNTAGPKHSLKSIADEALGRTNDTSDYVFLSDGGHFDNLGLYEMVLRRCRYIVACDASQDERYAFGDLANAVRKIRIDLGIDIRLKSMFIGDGDEGKYCALGCIDYDRIDYIDKNRPQKGFLLYIKPAVYSDCPADVRNYRKENKPFPHESTADQFFSESQFESYRALGQHGIRQICATLGGADDDGRTVWELFSGASRYLQEKAAEDEAVRFFAAT